MAPPVKGFVGRTFVFFAGAWRGPPVGSAASTATVVGAGGAGVGGFTAADADALAGGAELADVAAGGRDTVSLAFRETGGRARPPLTIHACAGGTGAAAAARSLTRTGGIDRPCASTSRSRSTPA